MVFMYRPKPFSRVLVPLYLEPIRCFLLGYAATRFLRMASMQRLVQIMETYIKVRSFVRSCFLWFACAWRFSIIRLSMRFCTFGVLAWLLMFRLRSIPFRTSISIFLVIVSHTSFANAERYRGVFFINSHFLLTLWWAFASAFLFVANCFWLAFLFIEFLLLFVACFIVCRFCCTPPTICSVNSEVVSKFDAAKVTRF